MSRKQCAKCPWKVGTDPNDIPGGYSEDRHRALRGTIREGIGSMVGPTRLMSCHEFPVGAEQPCVGWLAHQLGPGNNLGLRLAAMSGRIDTDFTLDGEQHSTFEETLP